MIKRNPQGILNAIVAGVTNARLEGINTVIQGIERTARGFRGQPCFRNVIYLHFGGLDLYADSLAGSDS